MSPLLSCQLLKEHFKQLSLALHPDKNKTPGADKAFQMLVEAYKALKVMC